MRIAIRLVSEPFGQSRPYMGVGGADVIQRWRKAGADRPDRLVGDHQVGGGRPVRHRPGELPVEDSVGLAAAPLRLGLADAEDGEEPGPPGGLGLGADLGVGFLVVGAALGMADDDQRAAGVGDHLGRDVAGMGAGFVGVAVLPADLHRRAGDRGDSRGDQRRRRADRHVAVGVGRSRRRSPSARRGWRCRRSSSSCRPRASCVQPSMSPGKPDAVAETAPKSKHAVTGLPAALGMPQHETGRRRWRLPNSGSPDCAARPPRRAGGGAHARPALLPRSRHHRRDRQRRDLRQPRGDAPLRPGDQGGVRGLQRAHLQPDRGGGGRCRRRSAGALPEDRRGRASPSTNRRRRWPRSSTDLVGDGGKAPVTVDALLSLGGNVGDRKALHGRRRRGDSHALARHIGTARSSYYRTAPDGPVKQDWFLNIAVCCQHDDDSSGDWPRPAARSRRRSAATAPARSPGGRVPSTSTSSLRLWRHDRRCGTRRRAFVLVPLAEIAPLCRDRGSDLAARVRRRTRHRETRLAGAGLTA